MVIIMNTFDKILTENIHKLGYEILAEECKEISLELFGKLLKKVLINNKFFFEINNKRISPNKYFKYYYKNFSNFIIKKTNFSIRNNNNKVYILFS
jgi:hypothetical protein